MKIFKPVWTMTLVAAIAGCEGKKAEIAALNSRLTATQGELAKAREDLSKTREGLTAAERARTDAQQKASALEPDLAKAREDLKAAETREAAAREEKDKLASDLKADLARAEGLYKELADTKGRVQDLQATIARKDQEVAQLRAEAASAFAKAGELEHQMKQPAGDQDLLARLSYAGTESIPSYQLLPLSFVAKKGEVLNWSWTVTATPANLSADALDFSVVGPDQLKAYGVRAGLEKKEDRESLTLPADGRWTVVWSNRHPSEGFTVKFEASLKTTP